MRQGLPLPRQEPVKIVEIRVQSGISLRTVTRLSEWRMIDDALRPQRSALWRSGLRMQRRDPSEVLRSSQEM
jgi:hypothetical protein